MHRVYILGKCTCGPFLLACFWCEWVGEWVVSVLLLFHLEFADLYLELVFFFAGRENELPSVASNTEGAAAGSVFNPEHPYAFVPPDYDSLPKEPPKYSVAVDSECNNAHSNQAFVTDIPPPPQFQEEADSLMSEPNTPPPVYEEFPAPIANISREQNAAVNPAGVSVEVTSSVNTVNPSINWPFSCGSPNTKISLEWR